MRHPQSIETTFHVGGTSYNSDSVVLDKFSIEAKMQLEYHPIDEVRKLKVVVIGGNTSPAHYSFVQADREHRDNVSVLPCSPKEDKN